MVVIGLGKNLLFKSVLAHCALVTNNIIIVFQYLALRMYEWNLPEISYCAVRILRPVFWLQALSGWGTLVFICCRLYYLCLAFASQNKSSIKKRKKEHGDCRQFEFQISFLFQQCR